jgi:hypothetical protein
MWGHKCFIRGDDWTREFIASADWFRGVELETDDRPGNFRVSFGVGGFWALRTSWIYRLDWPDRRLVQFGEDFMLGEALRQSGGRVGHCHSGVIINDAKRRAPPEMPRIMPHAQPHYHSAKTL